MISVDGPPEEWAGDVARLMVDRGDDSDQLLEFFAAVFGQRSAP